MDNPLGGKKILVPRSKYQSFTLTQKIEELGGIAVEIPLLAMREKNLLGYHIQSLKQSNFDWIVFTSSNGVHAFFRQWKHQNILSAKIAVIGKKTTEVLSEYGYKADFIPSQFVAEQFIREFIPFVSKQDRIFLIKGNLARDYIKVELNKVSCHVEEAILYETYFPTASEKNLAKKLKNKGLDILLFTSTSTVHHFMQVVREYDLVEEVRNCLIVSIGPVTTQSIKNCGLHVDVTAEPYTAESMINGLVNFLNKEQER